MLASTEPWEAGPQLVSLYSSSKFGSVSTIDLTTIGAALPQAQARRVPRRLMPKQMQLERMFGGADVLLCVSLRLCCYAVKCCGARGWPGWL